MDDRRRNRTLAVLFVGVLMGALDIAIVGPALPAIQAEFGLDSRAASWIFSSYVLANLIGTPLMAKLSDLFGRRAIYVLDVALFAAGSLVVALSHGTGLFVLLLAGRAIQGFGAGGIFPVASAVIGDTFPPEKRGGALGLIGAVFGLAFIIGPVVGGLLLGLGWQWLFLINLPIAAVVVVLAWRLLPHVPVAGASGFDWPGMIALAVALGTLAYGLGAIDTTRFWASLAGVGVWPWLLASAVAWVVLVLVERTAANPVFPTGAVPPSPARRRLRPHRRRRARRGQPCVHAAAGRGGARRRAVGRELPADAGGARDERRLAAGRPAARPARLEGRDPRRGGRDDRRHVHPRRDQRFAGHVHRLRRPDRAGVVRAAGGTDPLRHPERDHGSGAVGGPGPRRRRSPAWASCSAAPSSAPSPRPGRPRPPATTRPSP